MEAVASEDMDSVLFDSNSTPYRNLWSECLAQAILHAKRNTLEGRNERYYLLYCDDWYVGSFNWICEHLGLSSEELREKLARQLKEFL